MIEVELLNIKRIKYLIAIIDNRCILRYTESINFNNLDGEK